MYASLASPERDEELHLLKDGKTRCTTGSVVSSLYHLKDPEADGAWFDILYFLFFFFFSTAVALTFSYPLSISFYLFSASLNFAWGFLVCYTSPISKAMEFASFHFHLSRLFYSCTVGPCWGKRMAVGCCSRRFHAGSSGRAGRHGAWGLGIVEVW